MLFLSASSYFHYFFRKKMLASTNAKNMMFSKKALNVTRYRENIPGKKV